MTLNHIKIRLVIRILLLDISGIKEKINDKVNPPKEWVDDRDPWQGEIVHYYPNPNAFKNIEIVGFWSNLKILKTCLKTTKDLEKKQIFIKSHNNSLILLEVIEPTQHNPEVKVTLEYDSTKDE
ncbi:hypothetical protein HYD66_00890 [Mycoplasmopsis bovis]|nr:hypothetical protein [Mycoplasmopsis bovis]QQH55021.1 hypothetical protein HYD66_00890 [Mycoplasmopsis bovis]